MNKIINLKKYIKYIPIIFVIIIIGMICFAYLKNFNLEEFATKYYNSFEGTIFLLILYTLSAITIIFIPKAILYGVSGIIFSPMRAIFLTIIGLILEYTIDFFIGKKFGSKIVHKIIGYFEDKNKTIRNIIKKDLINNPETIILLRLLPGPPTPVYSLFFGAYESNYKIFICASIIGSIPGFLINIFLGKNILNPLSPEFIIAAILFIGFLAIGYFISHKRNKKEKNDDKVN